MLARKPVERVVHLDEPRTLAYQASHWLCGSLSGYRTRAPSDLGSALHDSVHQKLLALPGETSLLHHGPLGGGTNHAAVFGFSANVKL
jgi:hypothetical protein